MSESLRVLLCAAGRRPYLLRWFREGLRMNGIEGSVILADGDRHAGGRQAADLFVHAPAVIDDHYTDWLRQTLEDHRVDLAISVNDFELSAWSELESEIPALVRLGRDQQSIAEDKAAMALALTGMGVGSPPTWVGSQVVADPSVVGTADGYVVKSRYGSGSVGLTTCTSNELLAVVQQASDEVYGRNGAALAGAHAALDGVIVQPRIAGVEYGLDVVADLNTRYRATFAREKLVMRGGETDKAVTVDGSRFEEHGRAIAGLLHHRGTVDADVLVDAEGQAWVIDVNPRFGGGYPLTHVAGAHLPAAMIAWALGRDADASWLQYMAGVVASKVVDVARAE